ncbi:ABC transporter substrate-binding protein [Agarivorans sp. TSD2052]|uniref:ABC transporter substrate-binding protein n=1 Tax=Agarivorans sp. TSD2052 TaxID=2937286 RepID=UPI00200EA3FE|nr:ABC transporter substrate-binding protein [Agarivorans sp. TSD2052]UPW17450.1 ABC transporter substrate-binding protein [Agarivorans sp. TSD2052]
MWSSSKLRIFRAILCGVLFCHVLGVNADVAQAEGNAETLSLTLVLMPSSGKQRQAYKQLIERFALRYPQVDVDTVVYENEYYKANIEDILSSNHGEGDLFFWFGGERLRRLAKHQLLLDMSTWWQQGQWDRQFSVPLKQAAQFEQAYYALPINYYQWGFYYRESTMRYYPNTFDSWPNMLNTCKQLAAKGQHLVTIGTKESWPVAAWFDYLNLRINGLAFHHALLAGEIPFSDARIKQVFNYWQQAIDAQCFVPDSQQWGWKQALPALYRGKAASTLMGNFFIATVPDRVKNDLKFAAFPPLISTNKRYEEAPIDVIVAHQHAKNNPAAYWFLDFLVSDGALVELNQQLGKINPLQGHTMSEDRFIAEGEALLADAHGITQFFDRDSPKAFALPAMDIMVEFLDQQISMSQALQRLETLRVKVFEPSQR